MWASDRGKKMHLSLENWQLLRIGSGVASDWSREITWPRYWPLIGWLGSRDLASDWELEKWPTDSAFLSLKLVSKLNWFNITFRNFAVEGENFHKIVIAIFSEIVWKVQKWPALTIRRDLHAFYFSNISEKPQSEVQLGNQDQKSNQVRRFLEFLMCPATSCINNNKEQSGKSAGKSSWDNLTNQYFIKYLVW